MSPFGWCRRLFWSRPARGMSTREASRYLDGYLAHQQRLSAMQEQRLSAMQVRLGSGGGNRTTATSDETAAGTPVHQPLDGKQLDSIVFGCEDTDSSSGRYYC